MVSHTYQFYLDSAVIRLPDIDDLLGKEVEVIIREVEPEGSRSNFDAIHQLLLDQASAAFFSKIDEPVTWQKQIRDEW